MIRRKFLGAILGAFAAPKVGADIDIYARLLGECVARDMDMKMRWAIESDHYLRPRFTGTIEGVRF